MSALLRARALSPSREHCWILTSAGECLAELSGRLRYSGELPAAGDWVTVTPTDPPLIVGIEPRRTCFTRRDPGGGTQVLAANLDVAFLVCGLDDDLNLARLDRYLVQTRQSGARPVIVFNKADLGPAPAAPPGVPAVVISAISGRIEALLEFVRPGETAALFGSSGAGKSTIANALAGRAVQAVGSVPGRHVTTSRRLIEMPGGWWLLDLPGLREIGLAANAEAVTGAFPELAGLLCRFSDCTHQEEPGCAVREALSPVRLASLRKLEREQAYEERQRDPAAARREKERWKRIHKAMRRDHRDR